MQVPFKALAALTLAAMAMIAPPSALAADPPGGYQLSIGDRLSISAFGRADLTGEFMIGADSVVRLPLLGAIPAAGRTREEIEAAVTARLSELLGYHALVTVDIAAYRPVFVIGDVISPGEVAYVPGMTALQAYAKAGGMPSLRQLPSQIASQIAMAQRDMIVAQDELNALLVRRAALDAALADKSEIVLPDELVVTAQTPGIVAALAAETTLLGAQREDMAARMALLTRERTQLGEEVSALERQIVSLQQLGEAVAEELKRMGGLAEQGLTTSQRMLELKRNKASTDSSRFEAAAFLSRAQQEITQLQLRMHEMREVQRRERLDERRVIIGDITRARARTEGAGRQMAALSQLSVAEVASGRAEITFAISRHEPSGARTFGAAAAAALQPGDIVQVTLTEPKPGSVGLQGRKAALAASTAE